MKRIGFVVLILAIILSGFALFRNKQSPPDNDGKISVVASFYPLYFFASSVGGQYVRVSNITPAGAEPHDYEPSAQDIVAIEKADVLILNGAGLEPWARKLQSNLAGRNRPLILTVNKEDADPHSWLDPVLAKTIVQRIAAAFVEVDPAGQSIYVAHAAALYEQLDQLDLEYRTGLSDCAMRDIVTSHDAFGYVAARYGFNQISIAGISPDEEPSARKLAQIADLVKKKNIKYIFFESLISPRLSQTLATETGAGTLVLDPIEGLSADDMAAGKDYFTQMRMNLQNLKLALQCRN